MVKTKQEKAFESEKHESLYNYLKLAGYSVELNPTLGTGIYGNCLSADFLLHSIFPRGLIIELKQQDNCGTTDEKIPYLVANIKHNYLLPTVLILEGKGWREGCRDWVKTQIGGDFLHVFNSVEAFQTWISAYR